MSNWKRPLFVLFAMGAIGFVACGDGGSGGDGGATASPDMATPVPDTRTPHLAAAAAAELHSIGVDKYFGKAVVQSEEDQGNNVTAVTFDPASGPECIYGAPYVAYFQPWPGGSDSLLLFLGGGGACWTGFCEATPIPDGGILPLGPLHTEMATNPFHGYNVLYLPYCDGSVFTGDNDVTDNGDTSGPWHFHGRKNLSAGLDLLKRLPDQKNIVIAGVSAGAYGTLAATAMVRLLYPKANLYVYDDSGPWLQNLAQTQDVEARIADWHFNEIIPPSCTACDGGRGQLINMMDWLVTNDDQLKVGIISYYQDSVIGEEFNKLTGDQYKQLLLTETGKIHDAHPDRVRRFMVSGTNHVMSLFWPNLVKSNGESLRDWADGLVHGGAEWQDQLGQ